MDEPVTGAHGAMAETRLCPACGAPLPADARSCLACGSMVVTGSGVAAMTADLAASTQPPEPPLWQPPSVDSSPDQAHTPLAPGEWRCQWCGAANPAGADRCVQCQAAYPDPARDVAMLAEAQRRLTIIEQELDARKRTRRFWGLLP